MLINRSETLDYHLLVSTRNLDFCPQEVMSNELSPKSWMINHIVNIYNSFKRCNVYIKNTYSSMFTFNRIAVGGILLVVVGELYN